MKPRSCFSLLCALVLSTLSSALPALGASRPPNIVFLFADDLGHGALGCYGQKKILTPNIDRLAAEGMRFTQCYAGSNVCAPSRSTLMTGLHTGHTAVRNNGKNRHLYDSDVTVAEVLKKGGYATGGFGKWGLGDMGTPGVAIKQGFDEWFGYYHQVHAHFYYPFWLWKNDTKFMVPENETGKSSALSAPPALRMRYSHDLIQEHALDFIRRHRAKPFFCYVPYTIPHVELTVPEDSEALYRGKFPKKSIKDPRPGYISSDDAYATYAGMVSRLDRSVGEVLALLKELELENDTVVFFSSDNGAQGNQWQPLADFFEGTGGLRGSKGNWYEGGIRDPLIVRWPGKIKASSVTDHVCAFWDVMPTLAELAGVEAPGNIDGISFAPTLLGQGAQKQHEFLYWEMPVAQGLTQAVRMGDWKAVKPRPAAAFELYDLKTDPKETSNVAGQHPEVMKKISEYLATARIDERDYPEESHPPRIHDYVR
jgi:arylsulfatase A